MARDTNLSRRRDENVAEGRNEPGIRTRALLLVSLVLIVAGTTASSLLIVRSRLRQQVQNTLNADLLHSVETFQDLAALRFSALERESNLLASLPRLKALMPTDDATIADDGVEFWQTSGNDLFGLTDATGRIVTADAPGAQNTDRLKQDVQSAIADPAGHYLLSNGSLYEYAMRPIYFGSASSGTLLGYVISGYVVDHRFLLEVGRGAGAQAAFIAGGNIIVSTLPDDKQEGLQKEIGTLSKIKGGSGGRIVTVGSERFLGVSKDLDGSPALLQLVVLKSFDEADRAEREINRLLLLASALAMAAGSLLMILLARMVTRPLELLAAGVRAFGEGDPKYSLPAGGTLEVRYLSQVFARMRDEIQRTNHALLEAERLATIGRMASSVSHDLRHYLAAVYANAEFLASAALPSEDRQELFEEIRLAVNGTTDMLDSLLIFGRTGSALQRVPALMTSVVERAVTLVRTHPDAEQVTIRVEESKVDLVAPLDTKQIERAVYNLLLNACQSAKERADRREVVVSVEGNETTVGVTIKDSGAGVAEGIRESLFDPFVSQGKQKGTGLGLTLAWCVAREHGGIVELVSSRPGETVFRLTVSRTMPGTQAHGADKDRITSQA
jgi:signal transduction histidine kinase